MTKKWFGAVIIILIGLTIVNVVYGAQALTLIIKGEKVQSDRSPKIENGRTYVPLRVVSDYLGEDIVWDAKTKTVTVHPEVWEQDLQYDIGSSWINYRNRIIKFLMYFDERNDEGKKLVSKDFQSNIVGPEVVIPIGGIYPNMIDYKFIDAKIDPQTKIVTVRMKIWWYLDHFKETTWDISLNSSYPPNQDHTGLLITKLWEVDTVDVDSHTVFPGLTFKKP